MLAKSDQLHCDFCYTVLTESSPHKDYPCKDFDLPWPNNRSLGTWLACLDCSALVDAEKWEQLINRVMDIDQALKLNPYQPILRLLIREAYRRFKANRLDK